MKDKTKVKYITEIEVSDSNILVKKPFKLKTENQRKFVRIEISAPVSMKNLKNDINNIIGDDIYAIEGTILNMSANGILVELDETVALEDYLLMRFTIQETEVIDSILGIVKRVDSENESNLIGIEILSPKALSDRLSQPEIELLQMNIINFNDCIHDKLNKFCYKKV